MHIILILNGLIYLKTYEVSTCQWSSRFISSVEDMSLADLLTLKETHAAGVDNRDKNPKYGFIPKKHSWYK